MRKFLGSLLTVFVLSLMVGFSSTSASELFIEKGEGVIVEEGLILHSLGNDQGIEIYFAPKKPSLENIGGGSLTKMSDYQAVKFVTSAGYPSVHKFKEAQLKGITTKIAEYDLHYVKSGSKQVYLLRKNTSMGLNTGYYMADF